MLCTGIPPFDGKTDREIIKKVRDCQELDYQDHFYTPQFEKLDVDLKEMIRDMLNPNFHRRHSVDELIKKYKFWFNKFNENVDFDICILPLANLKKFNP